VITVGQLSKVRRLRLRDGLSIREIARRENLSRNTVKRWLAASAQEMVEPKYAARTDVKTVLSGYEVTLTDWLRVNAHKGKRERRTVWAMAEDLAALGYTGSYQRVAAFARNWKRERLAAGEAAGSRVSRERGSARGGKAPGISGAYLPLSFAPGEAYQFDWSTEYATIGGVQRRLEVAQIKLCYSRAFLLVAYRSQAHEMVFDAHARGFAVFGGVPRRGIYDNMKTAVDRIATHKGAHKRDRVINNRFAAMAGHYLIEAEFCTPASGWEKGRVEKNVQDVRRSIFAQAINLAWPNLDALNAHLRHACERAWQQQKHPENPLISVGDALEDERSALMPNPRPFDGYIEIVARVSPTCLITLQRNRYSVPCEWANRRVSLRLYPDRIDIYAMSEHGNGQMATHPRSFERDQTIFDWQHYIGLIERKPGALRNAAPFAEGQLPRVLSQLKGQLMRHQEGAAIMCRVLSAVPRYGLEAVLVAVELALESGHGRVSAEHVINVLSRLGDQALPDGLEVTQRPRVQIEPQANVERYDALIGVRA